MAERNSDEVPVQYGVISNETYDARLSVRATDGCIRILFSVDLTDSCRTRRKEC